MTGPECAAWLKLNRLYKSTKRKKEEYMRFIFSLAALLIVALAICILQDREIKECKKTIDEFRPTLYKTCDAGPSIPETVIPVSEEPTEPTEPETQAISLGIFTCYAYSADYQCTGKNPGDPAYGITKSGTVATAGKTVAVDPDVIPLGSLILVDGVPYIAEDTGDSYIKGNAIDIFVPEYQQAVQYGVQQHEVWIVLEGEQG